MHTFNKQNLIRKDIYLVLKLSEGLLYLVILLMLSSLCFLDFVVSWTEHKTVLHI